MFTYIMSGKIKGTSGVVLSIRIVKRRRSGWCWTTRQHLSKEVHHLPPQPLLVLPGLLFQGLDLVSELLLQLSFLLEEALLLLLDPLSLCMKFRSELENMLTNLIITSRPPNRGSVHRAKGHTISIVGPYAVYAILVRTADCIYLHHVLVNRWAHN